MMLIQYSLSKNIAWKYIGSSVFYNLHLWWLFSTCPLRISASTYTVLFAQFKPVTKIINFCFSCQFWLKQVRASIHFLSSFVLSTMIVKIKKTIYIYIHVQFGYNVNAAQNSNHRIRNWQTEALPCILNSNAWGHRFALTLTQQFPASQMYLLWTCIIQIINIVWGLIE